MYKPLQIENRGTYGVAQSLQDMRLPHLSEEKSDSIFSPLGFELVFLGTADRKLASRLIRAGDVHAKAMRGIQHYFRLTGHLTWMIEFETYLRGVKMLGDDVVIHSTSSTMYSSNLKRLKGEELAELKAEMANETYYIRGLSASYQALRHMYLDRKNHRHPDWRIFCEYIETLPYFDTLIMPELGKYNE